MSRKTVLMLAATPPDHPRLSLAEEHDQIKDLLERAQLRRLEVVRSDIHDRQAASSRTT